MKKQHEVECYDSTTGQTKSFPLEYLISLLFKYLLHCAEMYIHHKPIKRINEIDGEITAVYARNNYGDSVVDGNGDGNGDGDGNNRSRDVFCNSSSSRDASIDKIIHRVVIG